MLLFVYIIYCILYFTFTLQYDRCRFGLFDNIVDRINEVNRRRARVVSGWMTICRRENTPSM